MICFVSIFNLFCVFLRVRDCVTTRDQIFGWSRGCISLLVGDTEETRDCVTKNDIFICTSFPEFETKKSCNKGNFVIFAFLQAIEKYVEEKKEIGPIMRIKEIREGINWLTLIFFDECGKEVLKKVLQHAKYANELYYYVIFGDSLHTADLSPYFKDYPELDMDYGMMQLKEKDLNNVDLIYDILNQYHDCHLYVNQDPEFMQRNTGKTWRDAPIVKGGYSIDMLVGCIQIVQMSDDLPAWKPLINEFELIKQVNLVFPVFVLEAADNYDCSEVKLQCVITNEKIFRVVRKDLANSNHYARKVVVDSGGNVYRIIRAHVVDEPLLANIIKSFFHSVNEERVYVEFEYEDEAGNIPFEEFKKMVISILEKRNGGGAANRDYTSLRKSLISSTSFREMATLIVKKRMVRNKWG